MSVHLNWRGVAILALLTAAMAVGLYLGAQEVAQRASMAAVTDAKAELRQEFYVRDVQRVRELRVGCERAVELKRYLLDYMTHAQTPLDQRLLDDVAGIRATFPPAADYRIGGSDSGCDDAYPLPVGPS